MFPDGICRVGKDFYTKTIQFQDINYQLAQQEDQTEIFEEWCSFLNFFDSSVKFELNFLNTVADEDEYKNQISQQSDNLKKLNQAEAEKLGSDLENYLANIGK